MAKDGTNRGGARAGAGRKKKALADKVAAGRTDNLKVLPTPADLAGEAMPPIREFMKAKRRGGKGQKKSPAHAGPAFSLGRNG